MTFTPLGFEGSIGDQQFSIRSRFDGQVFPTVGSKDDLSLYNGTADRSVNIKTGSGCAHAIMVVSDTIATLQLETVTTAGASRWDAICLRYDWNANSVTPVIVKGVAAANAPATLPSGVKNGLSDIGQVFDHVLGLAQVQNGLSAVQQIIDKRVWGHKRYYLASRDALPPATPGAFGAECVLPDGTTFRCLLDSSNNLAWVTSNGGLTELTGTSVFVANGSDGWIVDPSHLVRCLIAGPYERQIDIQVRNFKADLNAADDDGNFGDVVIGTFQGPCVPDVQTGVSVNYLSGATDCHGWARVIPNGNLILLSGQPTNNLSKSDNPGTFSVRVSLRFSTRKAAA